MTRTVLFVFGVACAACSSSGEVTNDGGSDAPIADAGGDAASDAKFGAAITGLTTGSGSWAGAIPCAGWPSPPDA